VLVFWVGLVSYVFWFSFKAETLHPMSQASNSLLTVKNETVGFRCECAMFVQKRLISKKAPTHLARENPGPIAQSTDIDLTIV
jgi:hypothetical protein